jgi:hypothetical protein
VVCDRGQPGDGRRLNQDPEGAGDQAHSVQQRGVGYQDDVVHDFAHQVYCFGDGFPHGQAVGDRGSGFDPDDTASPPAVGDGWGGGGADADDSGSR